MSRNRRCARVRARRLAPSVLGALAAASACDRVAPPATNPSQPAAAGSQRPASRSAAALDPKSFPFQRALPPVLRSARSGSVWSNESWSARRAEILELLEKYAVGHAPPAPDNLQSKTLKTQTLAGGAVEYQLQRLDFGPNRQLHLHVGLFLPAGRERMPVVIFPAGTPPGARPLPRMPLGPGQGQGASALDHSGPGEPAPTPEPLDAEAIASTHPVLQAGFALAVFDHNETGEDTTLREGGQWSYRKTRFFPAYPEYDWGLLRAWAWGMSRIVDYLRTDQSVDGSRIVVSGFSRTGKAALVAGAMDDRIAMVAPVATGGGGVGAFRRSGEGRGGKEGLDLMLRKYPNWFSPALLAFRGHTEHLPFDQHFFIAATAPRAFIALESEADPVSLEAAVKQSILAAKPAYAFLESAERLGVHYADREHAVTEEDWGALVEFARSRLLDEPISRRFDDFPSDTRLPHRRGHHADQEHPSTSSVPETLSTSAGAPIENTQPPGPQHSGQHSSSAQRRALWNGESLEGWVVYLQDEETDPRSVWSVQGGALRLDAPGHGYIRTKETHADYHLHVEWRWPDHPKNRRPSKVPNSGVMVHLNGPDVIWPASYEAQLKHDNAGQFVGMGLDVPSAPLMSRRKRSPRFAHSTEAPLGEWNDYDLYCDGDSVDTFVNGVRQNYAEQLSVTSGHIALQMEGYPIDLRNIWIEPLN